MSVSSEWHSLGVDIRGSNDPKMRALVLNALQSFVSFAVEGSSTIFGTPRGLARLDTLGTPGRPVVRVEFLMNGSRLRIRFFLSEKDIKPVVDRVMQNPSLNVGSITKILGS